MLLTLFLTDFQNKISDLLNGTLRTLEGRQNLTKVRRAPICFHMTLWDKLEFTDHWQVCWVEEKSSSRKKFESPKKSSFFSLELFSSKFFLVHMEAVVLQQWQTTHFKAYSKG